MKTADDILGWVAYVDDPNGPGPQDDRATAERIARALRVLEVVESEFKDQDNGTDEDALARIFAALTPAR